MALIDGVGRPIDPGRTSPFNIFIDIMNSQVIDDVTATPSSSQEAGLSHRLCQKFRSST